ARDCLDAGAELRAHPAGDSLERLRDLADGRVRAQRRFVGRIREPARDVGEEDRLVGAQRCGDLAGRGVGVDDVGVALATCPCRAPSAEATPGMKSAAMLFSTATSTRSISPT